MVRRRANTGFFKDRYVNWGDDPLGRVGATPQIQGDSVYQPEDILSSINLIPTATGKPTKVYWQKNVPVVYGKSGNAVPLQEANQGAYDRFMLYGRPGGNSDLPVINSSGSYPAYKMQSPETEARQISYAIANSPKESAYDPDTLRSFYSARKGQLGLEAIEADISSRMGNPNPTWINPDYNTTREDLDLFSIATKQNSQSQGMDALDVAMYGGLQRNSKGQVIPEYIPTSEERLMGSYEYSPKGFLVDKPGANYQMPGAAIAYPVTPNYEKRNVSRIPTNPAPGYEAMQVNEYGVAVAPADGYIRPPVYLSNPDINPPTYQATGYVEKATSAGPIRLKQTYTAADPMAGLPSMASGGRWMGGGLNDSGHLRKDGPTNPLTNDNQSIRIPSGIAFVPMGQTPQPNLITPLSREELNPSANIMQYGQNDLYNYATQEFVPVESPLPTRVDAQVTLGEPVKQTPMQEIAGAYLPYMDISDSVQMGEYDPTKVTNRQIDADVSLQDINLADTHVKVGDEYFPLTPQANYSLYDEDEAFDFERRGNPRDSDNWWDMEGPSMDDLAAIEAGQEADFDTDIAIAAKNVKEIPAVYNDPNIYPTGALEAIQDKRAQMNRINAVINNRQTSPTANSILYDQLTTVDAPYQRLFKSPVVNPKTSIVNRGGYTHNNLAINLPPDYVSTNDLINQRNQLAADIDSASRTYSQLMQLEPAPELQMQFNQSLTDNQINQLEDMGLMAQISPGDRFVNAIAGSQIKPVRDFAGSLPFIAEPSRSQYPDFPLVQESSITPQARARAEEMRQAVSTGYRFNPQSPFPRYSTQTPEDLIVQQIYQNRMDNWQPTPRATPIRSSNQNYYDADYEVVTATQKPKPKLKQADPFKGEAAFEDTNVPNFATKQNQQQPTSRAKIPSSYARQNGINYVTVDPDVAEATANYFARSNVKYSAQDTGNGVIFSFDDSNPDVVASTQRRFNYQGQQTPPQSNQAQSQQQIQQAQVQPQQNLSNPNFNRGIVIGSLAGIPFAGSQYEQQQAEQQREEEAMMQQMIYGNPGMGII